MGNDEKSFLHKRFFLHIYLFLTACVLFDIFHIFAKSSFDSLGRFCIFDSKFVPLAFDRKWEFGF